MNQMIIAPDHRYRFDSDEWGLLGNAFNEVLHGFAISDFEHTIGIDRVEAERLLTQLHALSPSDEVTFDSVQVRAARNALRETIRELGVEEFDTRTGYDIDQATALLTNIDSFLSG